MIISDLNHFEEVVAEAPSIVGGLDPTISNVSSVDSLSPLGIELLSALGVTNLQVISETISQTPGTTASITTASGTTSTGEKIEVSQTSSSASA